MIKIGDMSRVGVYKISHPDTHRIYIGSTNNFRERARHHNICINNGTHHSKNLRIFAEKVDKTLFKFEVIEYCELNYTLLEEREQYYLNHLLKADQNNADFWRLGFNSNRDSKRKCKKISFGCALLQYDLEGNFIKEWGSTRFVENELNLKCNNISSAVKYKRRGGNFLWREYQENYPLIIEKYKNFYSKPILYYDIDGNFIEMFHCIADACKKLKISSIGINYSCKNNSIVKGYRFTYYLDNFPLKLPPYKYYLSKNIKVYVKETKELIGIFDSYSAVKRKIGVQVGTISKNLNIIPKGRYKYIFCTLPLEEILNN